MNTRSVGRFGVRDWLIQRVSAVIMAVYLILILVLALEHCPLDYSSWHQLFQPAWFKIASILFLLSVLLHAWIGMWTILTDYVNPWPLRFLFMLVFVLALVCCFFWGLQIFWGVN